MSPDSVLKAKQFQQRRNGRIDYFPQTLNADLQIAAERFDVFSCLTPLQLTTDTGHVGQSLIMQIHADALTFQFQRICQA